MRGLLDQREGWRRSLRWLRHLAVFPGLLSEGSMGLLVSSLALGEKALPTLIEHHGKAIAGLKTKTAPSLRGLSWLSRKRERNRVKKSFTEATATGTVERRQPT